MVPLSDETLRGYSLGNSTLTGEYLPNWRALVAAGSDATTPLSAVEYRLLSPIVPVRHRQFTQWNGVGTVYPGFFDDDGEFVRAYTPEDSQLSSAQNLTKRKLAKHLSSKWKGLTFLGELRESLKMIRNPAESLRGLVMDYYKSMASKHNRALKRGRKSYNDFTKTIADSWLEHSFGWAPLIGDVSSGYDAFRAAAARTPYETFKFNAKAEGKLRSYTFVSGSGHFNWRDEVSVRDSSTCRISGAIRNSLDLSCRLVEEFGLWPAEVVPTAWELVPWSFLVDYFTNVGDVLDSWATFRRVNLAWCCQTDRQMAVTRTRRVVYTNNPASIKFVYSYPGSSDVLYKSVNRYKLTSLTPPSFEFKVKLSGVKLFNIASLLEGQRQDVRRAYLRKH